MNAKSVVLLNRLPSAIGPKLPNHHKGGGTMKKSLLLKVVSAIVILVAVLSPLAVTTPAMAADLISCDENGKCTVSLLYYGESYAVNYEHAFELLGKGGDSWTFPGGNVPIGFGERLGDINSDTVFLTLDNGHNQTIKAAGLCDVSAILHWYTETYLDFSVDNPGKHSQVPVLPDDERYWDVVEENASGVYIADTIFHNPGPEVTIFWTIENHTLTIWNSRNGGDSSFQAPVLTTITEPVWEGDYIHEKCPSMDTNQSDETTYPKGIVIHHTVGSGGGDWFAAAIGSRHCGESRPPYLLVIDTEGVIHQTAAFGSTTFHACCDFTGNNHDYVSIALVGNYVSQEPSKVMQDALVEAIMWLESKGVTPIVKGHREVVRTECPGDALQALLPELAIEAQRRQTVFTVAGTTQSWLPMAVSADIWWWAGGAALVLLVLYWLGDYAKVKRAVRQGRVLPTKRDFDRLIRWFLVALTLLVAIWLATGKGNFSLSPTKILEVGLGVGVVVLFTTRTSERRVTLGWLLIVLGSLVAILHWGPQGDLIILMAADVVAAVVTFFMVERWLVKQRVHWKGDHSNPIIPYDIREGIYGFGVMVVLAYLVGVMITLVRMPPPGYAAEWGWFNGGTPYYFEQPPSNGIAASGKLLPKDELLSAMRTYGFTQEVIDRVDDQYDTIVTQSKTAGYNPAVTMAIWLEETHAGTASNKDFGCSERYGVGFDVQLECWLGLWEKYSTSSTFAECRGSDGLLSTREFFLIYEGGFKSCRANDWTAEPNFQKNLTAVYKMVTNGGVIDFGDQFSTTLTPNPSATTYGPPVWPYKVYPDSVPFGGSAGWDYLGKHTGIDLWASAGTPVYASCSGVVVWWDDWPWEGSRSWVNTIWIDCQDGTYFGFTHLDDQANHAVVGDQVELGQQIAVTGPIERSGVGDDDHLHWMRTSTDPTKINSGNLYWLFENPAAGIDLALQPGQ